MALERQRDKAVLSLGEKIAQAGRRRFVGREAELRLFREALGDPDTAVIFVYGPGGIGKTSLLAQFEAIAREEGLSCLKVDGRNVEPSPDGFLAALRTAVPAPVFPQERALDALARYAPGVVMVDTYEVLEPLDGWLRSEVLPLLPASTKVVIAGRNPPSRPWRSEPGLADLTRLIRLRNLEPEECRSYLRARGVPEARHAQALAFTHGHPLALCLTADLLALGGEGQTARPESSPDIVGELLRGFIERVPDGAHREALEVCAHARVTTEALLRATVPGADAFELFQWLRGLSFIEAGPSGLYPHDLARDVLDLDLRWRNRERFREVHGRVRAFVVDNIVQASAGEQQYHFMDLLFLHRHNAFARPFYDVKSLGRAYAEPASPDEHPRVLEALRRFEGEGSAEIARQWLQRAPQSFLAIRNQDARMIGFTLCLVLDEPALLDASSFDPALAAAARFVQARGGLRPGEQVIYGRFAVDLERYQELSPVFDVLAAVYGSRWLTDRRLAWSFIAMQDPDYWRAYFLYINHRLEEGADFVAGGRHFGVFAHDWRAEPSLAWLDKMAERELAEDMSLEALRDAPLEPLVVPSESEFAAAVRQALRDFRRPDRLAASKLLRCRLVLGGAGGSTGAERLQSLILEAAKSLRGSPRDRKAFEAVLHTYLEPAPTQEAAAERVDMPFSTYRRYLAAGVERITAWLWERELHGSAAPEAPPGARRPN